MFLWPSMKLSFQREDKVGNLTTKKFRALFSEKYDSRSGCVNWVGFYLVRPYRLPFDSGSCLLALGPFVGKVAVTRILYQNGVCGACARTGQTQLVEDVHLFPGHIACDEASQSEVVVPIWKFSADGSSKLLVGVLDMDCPVKQGFSESDARGLETISVLVAERTEWGNLSLLVPPPATEEESGACSLHTQSQ
eukprot:c767_g1_i1.p1 GENE.c767_g1_i1~~c767_g1_i1.p1  ORF type:complete len:193 (+),score=21.08 c767_g1_i1:115-693(+)